MKLDVHVCGRTVAKLYRERDEYLLSYLPDTDPPPACKTWLTRRSMTSSPPRRIHVMPPTHRGCQLMDGKPGQWGKPWSGSSRRDWA